MNAVTNTVRELTRADQIKMPLMNVQKQIQSLLGDKDKASKFMAASLLVASDQSLNRCSPESIVQAVVGVAMSDLNIDKNIGQVYLVPYKDSVQLQVSYKGFIQLLFRAGWLVKSFPVYHCDQFDMSFDGWDNKVVFKPSIDERDEGDRDWVLHNLRGIYVVARHAETKDEYSMFVNKTIIEKLRLNSPNQKITQWSKPEDRKRLEAGLPIGIWADWYIEMAQAKAVKKLAKILPIGDRRAQQILAIDDKNEQGIQVDYTRMAETNSDVIITSEPVIEEQVIDMLPVYPDDRFTKNSEQWANMIKSGSKTPAQIIATIETKNTLTEDQKAVIEGWAV